MLLTDMFSIAFVMVMVYIVMYTKTQKVEENGLVRDKIIADEIGVTSNFIQKVLF